MVSGAEKDEKVQPPPYRTGLYPMITGTVEVKGEVELDREKDKACRTQKGRGPPLHMDCYRGVRGTVQDWRSDSVSDSDEDEGGQRGRRSKVGQIELAAGHSPGDIFCSEPQGKEREEVETSNRSALDPLVFDLQEELRRSQRKKKSTKKPGLYPILVKGQQVQYIPWGSQDLEGVALNLPDITHGATKWIRKVEELTMGKIMAVGDLKALLARVLGINKMESLLTNGGLGELLNRVSDGTTFDTYRKATWEVLRSEYPVCVDHRSLRGHAIGDTENPATFLQKQVTRWHLETEKDPETDQLVSVLFRTAILEALPGPVKSKLGDVVGLTSSKTHKEFSDHLVHAVERYRQSELKIQEQSKEVQRKLTQLQLEELTKKEKKRQAVVVEPDVAIMQNVQQAPPQVQPFQQTFSSLAQQPQGQGSLTPPVVNIYTQNSGNPRGGNTQNQYRKQPKYTQQQGQSGYAPRQGAPGQNRGVVVCWGCNQEGHMRKECLTNPLPQKQQQGQQWQGQQGQGGGQQRQTGPFMGQGY
ncbi:hypothetical protein N1851_015507 [Merluccius polli]|uniref:CCHC-type domain-containing protein n=1 Tax=Merluccius polli TaxID=89951 RepID=A0AA47MRZ9_MERPO|nr:hypothetical protein N1851_015507 [Merluccius polli]